MNNFSKERFVELKYNEYESLYIKITD